MNEKLRYKCFIAALKWHIKDGGFGTKAHIAKNTSVTASYIGQISKSDATKKAKLKVQEEIAKFLRGSFDEFIKFGASLLNIETPRIQRDEPVVKISISDIQDPYKKRHHEKIEEFPDQKTALYMNSLAVDLAKKRPSELKEVINFIKYRLSQIDDQPAQDKENLPKNGTSGG